MGSAFRYNVDDDGIANVVFDLQGEKVNTISKAVMDEFEEIINSAVQNKNIKIMAISSSKPDIFIAGANLHAFEPMFKDPIVAKELITGGHRVFKKLSDLPFPTVALINGACLGGGTELALACTYRAVSDNPKTVIGLPEVTLGIIPGWGGTQRMPRLVGLIEGLTMVLGGKPVKGYKAWKMKFADVILPAEFFDTKSREFVKKCMTPEGKRGIEEKRKFHGWKHWLFESNPIGRWLVFRNAEKDIIKKTKGFYPAPIIALDLIKNTYTLPLEEGLQKEIDTFSSNTTLAFANAQHLIHLFFVSESLKKDSGVEGDVKPLKIASAGVIGAGTMGSVIAWLFSNKNIPVRMKDIDWNVIGKGIGSAHDIYSKLVKERKLKPNEANLKFHHISGTVDYSGFKNLDIVIEAAVESLDLKHKILNELEVVLRPDAIIASNTSSLTIADMGSVMKNPERFVGMHFFNPPNKMPLVEVVASDKTSPAVVATVVDICRKLGKTPIVVRDCPGFLVNRILVTGLNEIMHMYEEGAGFKDLEKMMLDFGMPMSPFILADEVGNDVSYKVDKTFENAYGSRMAMPKLIASMYDRKLFGKKIGKGFYIYKGDKKEINPEIEKLRDQLGLKSSKTLSETEMRDRTMLSMMNEAARCLQEKIVANPAYLDMAMVMGTGFPPFRGGLLRYADSLGIDYVVNQLQRFQKEFGERFAPCELLLEMQRNHKTFFTG